MWLLALILAAACAVQASEYGPVDCEGVTCHSYAHCVDGKCRCLSGYSGLGDMYCFPLKSYQCYLTCDPVARSRDTNHPGYGQIMPLHDPCRYVVQDYWVVRPQQPSCHISVYSFHSMYLAKVYIARIEIYIWFGPFFICIRIDAFVTPYGQKGQYEINYQLGESEPSVGGLPPDSDEMHLRVDDEDFVTVDFPLCGTLIRFRRFDPPTRHSVASGLAMSVDTVGQDVKFDGQYSVCLPPQNVGPSQEEVARELHIPVQYVALYRVLTNDVNQPNGTSTCHPDLKQAVLSCDDDIIGMVFSRTGFIYEVGNFAKCYNNDDPQGDPLVCLMLDLFNVLCSDDVGECLALQAYLGDGPCADYAEDFLSFDCNSLRPAP